VIAANIAIYQLNADIARRAFLLSLEEMRLAQNMLASFKEPIAA
jgi:hypothetical protein